MDTPPPRLTMAQFWQDLSDEVLSIDRGLPWTFARLSWRPGALVREYVQRRDPRIVRPLRYFLVCIAALAAAFHFSGASEAAHAGFLEGFQQREHGSEVAEAVWWVVSQVEWWLIGAWLPATASATCLAFRRFAPTFAEMWVLALYATGHALAWMSLPVVADAVLARLDGPGVPVSLFVFALPVVVLATAAGYFPGSRAGAWGRALLALLLSMALTCLLMLALVFSVASGASLLAG